MTKCLDFFQNYMCCIWTLPMFVKKFGKDRPNIKKRYGDFPYREDVQYEYYSDRPQWLFRLILTLSGIGCFAVGSYVNHQFLAVANMCSTSMI